MNPTESSSICKVCGESNAAMAYGVISCSPCKIFFRRNALTDLNVSECVFGQNCDVTINSRGSCKFCRLKKCFFVGMQKESIRAQRTKQIKKKTIHPLLPTVISTIDLLTNDRSLLKADEWPLITYINNAYDEKSLILTARHTIDLQLKQSAKLRFKMATNNYNNIVHACFVNVGKFMNEIPQFKAMSVNDQSALVERNIYTMGSLGGILVLNEVDICADLYNYYTAIDMYGSRIVDQTKDITSRADPNGLLLKLLLPILTFSTCTDILDKNFNNTITTDSSCSNTHFFSNTKLLFGIQNIYIELLFKYMLFRFGYEETILRFFGLVKTCLDLSTMLEKHDDTESFNHLVDTIMQGTEDSLTVQDQPMEVDV